MFGTKKWKNISVYLSKIFPDRPKNQKICKNRWFKNLNPKINFKGWSLVEEYVFFESQKKLGNKWATISKLLPGRTDNNIKNHFYSTLRKNIRRFLKDKSNFSCVKDKIKTFYTMMYAREKFNELKKFYNSESNTVDLKKAKRISSSENVNFDDSYISELICKSYGSIRAIDDYLTNLCLDLMVNNSEISSTIINQKKFDISSSEDVDIIHGVITNLVLKNAMNSCSKILPLKEDFENLNQYKEFKPNTEQLTNNKINDNIEISDINLSQSSENLFNSKKDEKQLEMANNQSNNTNRKGHTEFDKKIVSNQKLSKNLNQHKIHFRKSSHNHNYHPHYYDSKFQNRTTKSVLCEEKINSLINNFTKNFAYETNIFDNIKYSNFMSIVPDSSSPNNMISLMISKIFEDGNENNYLSNFFENKNINQSNNTNNIRDKVLLSLLDLDQADPLINNDLMEKLQSVSDFGLFKSTLEKIIMNNILQYYIENSDNINGKIPEDILKNFENSERFENLNFNHINYTSSNLNNNINNSVLSNLNLNDNDVQKIFKKFSKMKNDKSNSNSNYLQNKTNRSPSHQ